MTTCLNHKQCKYWQPQRATFAKLSVLSDRRQTKINARHDVRQQVRACLVCWDLLVSFYFYNGRHDMRCNGRILCAHVAPASKCEHVKWRHYLTIQRKHSYRDIRTSSTQTYTVMPFNFLQLSSQFRHAIPLEIVRYKFDQRCVLSFLFNS
jgi:hypothetical protein